MVRQRFDLGEHRRPAGGNAAVPQGFLLPRPHGSAWRYVWERLAVCVQSVRGVGKSDRRRPARVSQAAAQAMAAATYGMTKRKGG